jgi:colanic acid/amylovoran biosynthesis glycosyltransferase
VPRIGYLLNQYPAISHSFILREIGALRELGFDIDTFSIHRSDPAHILAKADREEYTRTFAVRPVRMPAFVAAHLSALRERPSAYVRALLRALMRGRRSGRDLAWQLFYFLEAVPIWIQVRRAGLRHVHAHFTNPAADVAMVVADLGEGDGGLSWSFSAHGADIQETDQRLLAEKIRRATRVVCVSDYGRSQLMAIVEPVQWPKITVVHCGVDGDDFPATRAARQDAAAAPTACRNVRPVRILNTGRLVPVKGQAVLLEGVSLVRQRGLDVVLTIVGDGPLRATLEDTARALGIEHDVEFLGRVGQDHIAAHYQCADLFCLPSLREGVPVVLMEAMASGVPVIATRIMGIPELVEDEVTGLLVPPGRAEPLADAIVRLAGDAALRNRLTGAARARIATEYDVRTCARHLASVLADAASVEDPAAHDLPTAYAGSD